MVHIATTVVIDWCWVNTKRGLTIATPVVNNMCLCIYQVSIASSVSTGIEWNMSIIYPSMEEHERDTCINSDTDNDHVIDHCCFLDELASVGLEGIDENRE